MFLKFLLFVAVAFIIYLLFFKKRPLSSHRSHVKEEIEASEMIECNRCGVYCELDDALLSNGKYYCGQKCLDKIK